MSEPGHNPWLDPGEYIAAQPEVARPPVVSTGPTQPHPGAYAQPSGFADSAFQPAQTPESSAPGVWIVGVHGGAGDSTISELSPHFREAHHRWPQPPPYGSVLCLMVARTNAADLHNARAAAREWAAGAQPHVVLLGLPPGALPTTRIKRMTCGQAQDILAKPIEWPADVVRAATELSAVDSLMCLPSLRKPTRGAGTPSAKRNRRAHAPMKT